MTDLTVVGAFAFMVLCLLLVAVCAAIVHVAHDWAEDRAREARLAEEWRLTHREHQDRGRYLTSDDRRPE